jgi:hypothetical protein
VPQPDMRVGALGASSCRASFTSTGISTPPADLWLRIDRIRLSTHSRSRDAFGPLGSDRRERGGDAAIRDLPRWIAATQSLLRGTKFPVPGSRERGAQVLVTCPLRSRGYAALLKFSLFLRASVSRLSASPVSDPANLYKQTH